MTMNTTEQHYTDITTETFMDEVIHASANQVVMVDFWADWCGPCRSLTPILEKLVVKYRGTLKLVKVNTDQQQELAAQFGIRSLPAVFFFKHEKLVDQFMGVQPESAICSIIDRHLDDLPAPNGLELARQHYEQGRADEAKYNVRQLSDDAPDDDDPKLLLIEWLVAEGSLDEAKEIADKLSDQGRESKAFKGLAAALELRDTLKGIPPASDLLAAIAADENDHQARYHLAQRLVAEQNHVEGMDQLLEIIRRDRGFQDEAARTYMIKVFQMLGGTGELVNNYRSKLARILN